MSAPEWETSKENVAPLVRGRNVETLNKALTKSPAVLEQEREFHQAAIREASSGTGPYADDPLAPWVTFAKWAVDNFPRGSDLIVAAVEGACRKFSKDELYREDRRFVRLWIRYADMRTDKLDVFSYMQKRRIGEHAALFYEAWATTLELERQYDRAEATYALGRRMNAEPQTRLAQREREFFNRMAARRRRAEKKAQEAEEKLKAAAKVKESTRANRGRTTLADQILSKPDVRSGEDDGEAENNENTAPGASKKGVVRAALGRISERQAQTGRRPVASVESKTRQGLRERLREQPPAQNNTKRKADKIAIYADPEPTPLSPISARRETLRQEEQFPLPLVAKLDEVRKENDGKPAKWVGETLPQNENAKTKLRRGGLAIRPAFQILQDRETDEPDGSHSQTDKDINPSKSKQLTGTKGSTSPKPTRKSTATIAPSSPTINTKIAMRDIDDMFNTSLPMERAREKVMAESIPAAKLTPEQLSKKPKHIQIYHDVDNDDDKENEDRSSSHPQMEGPAGYPALEKRVLQPIPELEVSNMQMTRGESDSVAQVTKEAALPVQLDLSRRNEEADLFDFLAEWCSSEPTYYLLDGPDPKVEKDGMFSLHPKQNSLDDDKFRLQSISHSVIEFNVDNFLWPGYRNVSRVVPVEDMNDVYGLSDRSGMDEEEEDNLLALKLSETSNAWEFYIYKTLHDRYGATLKSVPTAIAFYEGSPQTYLVLDVYCTSSLSRAMALQEDKHFSESLAMFFTADLLRTLEAIHTVGILHCDVTLENILFRNSPMVDLIEDRYVPSGAGSWGSKGVLLVDFNHAVDSKQAVPEEADMKTLAKHVSDIGNDFLHPDYRIPNASTWCFNGDCYAAAVCAAKMLGLSKLSTRGPDVSLKHERVWNGFFSAVQNLSAISTSTETVGNMRQCREEMEKALESEKWLKKSVSGLSSQVETCDVRDDTMV